ncbi:MAG: OmpA family protein [Bacteroidota bacterium]
MKKTIYQTKKILYIITVASLMLNTEALAQNVEFKASNFKDRKEEFKVAVSNIKAGDEYLEASNEAVALVKSPGDAFKNALKLFLNANDFNSNSAMLNMKIGNCYLYTNEKFRAKEYLDKSLRLDNDVDPMLHFYLGQSFQLNYEFDKAIEHYKIFEEIAKNKYVEEYKKLTTKYKEECKSAKELIQDPQRVWVDNLDNINTSRDDYSPCISADGELLIFTSRRKNSHQPNGLGEYDSDIYTSALKDEKWLMPVNMGSPLNTEADETASGLSYDGQRMLLFKVENNNADVYESVLNGIEWSTPKRKMSSVNNTEKNETYASYEPQDIKVYYINDGGFRGDNEIYFSGVMVYTVASYRPWGKGQSVGHKINTHFHEGSVFIHPDGQTMYFSSQGHNSMGGYDIFISVKDKLAQWSIPVNLGYPINTPYDDLFFAATANGKHAYIASNRDGGKGGMDIYKVTFWGPKKPILIDTEDYLLASIAEPVKDVHIEKAVVVERRSLTVFKGRVIDAISRKPVEASIEITDNLKGEVIQILKSNSVTGKFLLSLPSGLNYGIAVKAEGYLFHSENFDIPEYSEFNMVNKDIELKNIVVGSKITLKNIFFAFAKADLTPASNMELSRLEKLLNEIPTLKIEISGHTDNTGSKEFNLKLSDERAKVVVEYLIQKGINASRLTAKGYGQLRPVDTNDTSEGRQQNRRTEFEIVGN